MSGLKTMMKMTELRALILGTTMLIVGAFAAMWGLALVIGALATAGVVVFIAAMVVLVRTFMKYQWPDLKAYMKWLEEDIRNERKRNSR